MLAKGAVMAETNKLQEVIFSVIDELNLQRPADQQITKRSDTVLVGEGGLDSLGLVNFVVLLEERLDAALNMQISLVSDGMDFHDGGAFSSVRALVTYIETMAGR